MIALTESETHLKENHQGWKKGSEASQRKVHDIPACCPDLLQ